MKTAQYGLRSTVRLFGTVVDQRVDWHNHSAWTPIQLVVPTKDGLSPGQVRWSRDSATIREADGTVTVLDDPDSLWLWTNGAGVEVSVDRIQMVRAKRTSGEAWGDVALLVSMLTLMVGLGQLNTMFAMFAGDRVEQTVSLTPSPELIARLLRQEFDGEKRGRVAMAKRPELKRKAPSYYMPSGSNGPIDRMGGGAKAGESPRRATEPRAVRDEQTGSESRPKSTATGDDYSGVEDLLAEHLPARPAVPAPTPRGERLPTEAIERFVGWGFRDWLAASEVPAAEKDTMQDRAKLAQQLLHIDPDDPFALLTMSNYAYLSENYTLCRALYARYLELYPGDAAGWNNLALTYKRTQEYKLEEKLYRLALALEPNNFFTKNNLAVNLAHQGRYNEADSLMISAQPEAHQRPYADLHLAKIAAAQGQDRRAYRHLKRALDQVFSLGTSHHIEFRQDIRLDPSFDTIRNEGRFRRLLRDAYGEDTPIQGETAQLGAGKVLDG